MKVHHEGLGSLIVAFGRLCGVLREFDDGGSDVWSTESHGKDGFSNDLSIFETHLFFKSALFFGIIWSLGEFQCGLVW